MQNREKGLHGLMRRAIRPERVMAVGFFSLILVGAILLSLPMATVARRSIGFFNGLFTATSAVCVTGLIVVDTGTTFSGFGQTVLLLLIQMGGLGFMVFATLVMIALGRKISLRDRMMIRESMNTTTLSGLVRLSMLYGGMTLAIELMGAALLSVRMIPRYGVGRGIFLSIFHAISAFCNAGFDLFGHGVSLTPFARDPLVLLTISALIILGGLGFSVIFECVMKRYHWRRFTLHARLVIVFSAALLAAGTVLYLLIEGDNPATLGADSIGGFGGKVLNAFFQSVTMRTAGFNSIDLGSMRDASKLVSVILMFIGASPASTGGGVKTTTIGVLLLLVISVVRGQDDISVMKRRLPTDLIRRALAIMTIYLAIMLIGTTALTLAEGGRKNFIDLMFETTSALATVGVTSAGTANLTAASKILLIPLMYFGRVGPLTMALALTNKNSSTKQHFHYSEENITIG